MPPVTYPEHIATRMTRDEKRAQTRERLLEAAATVFARQGYAAASLDEIADAAGYSKGAIYSNYHSKEALFLAVLERHDAEQTASLGATLRVGGTLEERLASLGRWFRHQLDEEQDWALLSFEFTMYAARNPELAKALTERSRVFRTSVIGLVEGQASELGIDLPAPAHRIADMVLALGTGISVHRLTDTSVGGDGLFADAVALLLGERPDAPPVN
ncbi:MAG TPA: TetR/AcrR family transcriptional regulator [Acidimicrobiales bacterium]